MSVSGALVEDGDILGQVFLHNTTLKTLYNKPSKPVYTQSSEYRTIVEAIGKFSHSFLILLMVFDEELYRRK
jgi:hypothetical protein